MDTSSSVKITSTFLIVNGRRIGIYIDKGPWIAGVNPAMIKIRLRNMNKSFFPEKWKKVLNIENNSDSMTDYFERDCIRLLPGDRYYDMAKQAGAQ